jgi:hypothetical protein
VSRTLSRALAVLVLLVFFAGCVLLASAVLDRPASTVREEMVVSAPRVRIWRLLTDFEQYERWNPYVVHARGDARIGNELVLTLGAEDSDEIEPEVMDVKSQRKLRWRSRRLVPGVLDEEQTFRIIPLGNSRFRLVYEGRIEGVLAPFANTSGREQGYVRMLRALAREASRSDTTA